VGQSSVVAPSSTSHDLAPLPDATLPNFVGSPLQSEEDIRDVGLKPYRFLPQRVPQNDEGESGLCSYEDCMVGSRPAKVAKNESRWLFFADKRKSVDTTPLNQTLDCGDEAAIEIPPNRMSGPMPVPLCNDAPRRWSVYRLGLSHREQIRQI
jgi:hypothetical protein